MYIRRIAILFSMVVSALSSNGAAPVINGFDLLDAETGALIQSLENNDMLNLNELGRRAFWLRADVSGPGSVHFHESGRIDRIVNDAPYILGGSAGGTNGAWMPAPGGYTITVTPWEGPDATGLQGIPVVLNLAVDDALDHRMRTVSIQSAVPNAQVQIRMLKHAFPFGSMTKPGIEVAGTYQDTFFSNFNCSVVGNDMKWYSNQPDWWSQSPHNTGYAKPGNWRYGNADTWTDFMESHGVPLRGHTIFWGEISNSKETPTNMMQDPDWVEALGTNALYWIEQRASNIVSRYAGRIDEWDFNNEMWHGDWYRATFGNGITKQMEEWVRAANPNVELWFNEYGMLNNSNNAIAFRSHLQALEGEGVRIDGVGVQGHFSSAPNAATVKASLDILDDLGVPIKVTEFDCGSTSMTEEAMANGLETVYRTAFEHQAVEGIIMWGFWEGNHWKPERALWKTDWTPTEQAFRYRELVYDEWWSSADLQTDRNGALQANLFAGEYEITINGQVFTQSLSAGDGEDSFYFDGTNLHYVKAPEVVLAEPPDGAEFPSGPAIPVTADTSGGGSVSSVELFLDGVLVKTDGQPPYSAVLYDVAPGSHSLTAVAWNLFGDSVTSSVNTITVDPGNGNLVDNPGFESGITGWVSHGGHSIEAQGTVVYAGSQAGRAFDRDHSYDGLSQVLNGGLDIGSTYVFSCYARLGSGSDTVRMQLKTSYTTNGPTYAGVVGAELNDSGWTLIRGEYIFNPDPSRTVDAVQLYIASAEPGIDIFVDDVFIAETTLAELDYDSDGMPDSWEDTWFGGIAVANGGAFEDWDNDGIGNRAEYRSGTDPVDPASRLSIVSISSDSDQMGVVWQSVAGKRYRVLASSNLPGGVWEGYGSRLPRGLKLTVQKHRFCTTPLSLNNL